MESVAYVGMDVDKEKIAVALVQDYEDQPRMQRIIRNRGEAIETFFGEVTGRYDQVLACYEAGACGFELHRRVTATGAGCMVAAPASMPKKANDWVKTDRRDARKLAGALRNGDLSPVYVPSREDEAGRDFLRLYEDVKNDLKKAKQRLLHFLLRHEIRYEGGQNWTGKHWQWLRSLKFDSAIAGETFEEYLGEVTHLEEKRRRIATRVEALGSDDRYKEAVSRLRAFKGIGTLTALAFILEIGDFRRFARAEQFMAFLGLVPSEHSSGEKRRLGNITKAGNSHLRKLLVEAAWVSRRYGAPSKRLIRERSDVPAHIAGYAERAGKRLQKKYWRLVHAGRPPQVAATAVARELSGFIWGAMVGATS